MAKFEFKMPDVGEGLAEVEIGDWKVEVGDWVEENQTIADIETDKSVVSMPAPATGRITHLAAAAGEMVAVGALLLVIETEETESSPPAAAEQDDEAAAEPEAPSRPPAGAGRVAATPSARRLARELGVEIESVPGSGPRGRILPEDVQAWADRPATPEADAEPAAAAPEAAGEVEEVPLRGVRRRVAENLVESYREIPHVAGFHEFVVPGLVDRRRRLAEEAGARGVKVTYLAFVVRAVARALPRHPWLNASLDDDGQVVLLKKHYGIGIAVASPDGLVVPVIHDADRLDLFETAAEVERLARAAEERSLAPEELRGGTFTISNVGPAGGNYGTSLIRPPEVAILGLGRIHDRAVVEDGEVVARPVLPVSLTFDHRVVDGEQALAFVGTLREYLEEDPESLSP